MADAAVGQSRRRRVAGHGNAPIAGYPNITVPTRRPPTRRPACRSWPPRWPEPRLLALAYAVE